ncbi:heavy-metal-associated domain-containing protein [Aquimarina sp. D1M17]|uniref:heavy-metal-associated domain-containing protein n=1 Tax=Aquimarina acroporae TaxID=2937283 RepID=UPI0020BDA181|nr:heavy metal-associated domain-containing protein [Aquimarina acroporae]MCK8520918.1 heavy-metal-associated domain-containing protein [Aquimarina acroporae]
MRTTVTIQNLKCAGCESTIAKKLHLLEGIQNIEIDQENCTISFSYNTENGINTVEKELSRLGYPVEGDKNTLQKKAISYISCAIGKLST